MTTLGPTAAAAAGHATAYFGSMGTGFPESDAAAVFARQRRRQSLDKIAARLRTRRDDVSVMLPFEPVVEALGRVGERDLGLQVISLDSIVGTVDRRRGEFDRRFRPASARVRQRWQRIAVARRRGASMPPIDVYRIGDLHFVEDGHHRVSVAVAHGDVTIDARVREVLTRRPATHELSLRDLQRIRHEREFDERVPLPTAARARIQVTEGWRWDQLTTHVESWAFRASHADGKLLSRAEAAQAWFHEEYEPIADVLDELGVGGPGTETTRYLRIVLLRNLLMHERGWSDEVIERLMAAIRSNAPDESDEIVHRILKEMR
jgi:hypothetical protein